MSCNILAIETSCDDTCVSIISDGVILSNIISSQKIHAQYGGVVPELSAREHLSSLPCIVQRSLEEAHVDFDKLSAVAFTCGPGLQGPLLVGATYAKSLSFALNIPLIAVNHLCGHVFAGCIASELTFPFLCLLVSGGNTMIVKATSFSDVEVLCRTVDDALGEAYDKIAKIMGLEYPGGKIIDSLAKKGDEFMFRFPTVKISDDKMSFSGLKTAFRLFIEKNSQTNAAFIENNINNICASIQHHLLNTVVRKLIFWIKGTGIRTLTIGGGVASNVGLRNMLKEISADMKLKLIIPKQEYCVDNAAMIAFCAYEKYKHGFFVDYDHATDSKLKI